MYLSDSVACFYSYKESCIIHGTVNDSKMLEILDIQNIYKHPAYDVAESLRIYQKGIWINKHEPLKLSLRNGCTEFDITGENILENAALEDLWEELKATKRVKRKYDFKINGNSEVEQLALKILLKSLTPALCLEKQKILVTGTVRPIKTINYGRFGRN